MKYFKFFVLILLTITGCMGKEDNKTDDPYKQINPYTMEFEILDSNGNNLLDINTAGNWLDKKIECVFEGEHYYYPSSKLGTFYGMKIVNQGKFSYEGGGWGPHLRFGEFDPFINRSSQAIFLWPDGSTDVLTVTVYYNEKRYADHDFSIKINGRTSTLCVPLIKKPL